MSAWRPALRMARRDLRRHKVRAVLTCLLVALPVLVGTVAALSAHNGRWTDEVNAQRIFHRGDARVMVSEFTEVRVKSALNGWPEPVKGAGQRDPAAVDVASLLPAGTEMTRSPGISPTALSTGGEAQLMRIDLSSPLIEGIVEITQGQAPTAPDEVAVSRVVADELGMLESGRLRPDARFELAGGARLDVVGLSELDEHDGELSALTLVAPLDSVALAAVPDEVDLEPSSYLLDLPALDQAALRDLVDDLAAQGVALQPREAVENPAAWGLHHYEEGPVDFTPLIAGGMCVLVGLIEVVLLVGAAFSVAARRQVRDLGLLATNGGAGRDVRRVLLAQGVVLGVVSSLVGAAAGVAIFVRGAGLIEDVSGHSLHGHEVQWWVVAVIAALGSVTSMVAALLPGWRMGRLTPVDALSGRFPLQPGESRAHRPAFVLAGCGVVLLAAGGVAIAAAQRSYPNWVGVAGVMAGLGLAVLVAGTAWATPYVVRRAAALGRHLPLSGRYAFRDAGRHRFRSAAAVMALMITVAGAVLAGSAFASAERARTFEDGFGPGVLSICCGSDDPARLAAVRRTLDEIIEPEQVAVSSTLTKPGTERTLMLARAHDAVQVVDEASLEVLADVDEEALEVFRNGGVITTYGGTVRDGEVKVVLSGPRKRDAQWTLPATRVAKAAGVTPYTQPTYISPETAESLGVTASGTEIVVINAVPVSSENLERLRVHGFWAQSDDPERAVAQLAQYAGVGVAGLLAAIVVGIAVALAAAESRDDVATLAAVGAAPWTRRRFGAMHGLFLGVIGTALGAAVGVTAGLAFTQLDGLPGMDVPWTHLLGTVALVLPLSWLIGGLVTPSRFTLTRRTA